MVTLAIVSALAPLAFRLLEKTLGPKTGAAKMEAAASIVLPALEAAASAGKLGGAAPTKDALKAILEGILAVEKAKPDWEEAATLEWAGRTFNVLIVGEVK